MLDQFGSVGMPVSVAPHAEPVRRRMRGPREVVGAGGAGAAGDHELLPVDNQFDGIETGLGVRCKARHGILIRLSRMVRVVGVRRSTCAAECTRERSINDPRMKRLQNAACLASFRNRIPLAIVLVVASVRHCRARGDLRHTLTLVNGQAAASRVLPRHSGGDQEHGMYGFYRAMTATTAVRPS